MPAATGAPRPRGVGLRSAVPGARRCRAPRHDRNRSAVPAAGRLVARGSEELARWRRRPIECRPPSGATAGRLSRHRAVGPRRVAGALAAPRGSRSTAAASTAGNWKPGGQLVSATVRPRRASGAMQSTRRVTRSTTGWQGIVRSILSNCGRSSRSCASAQAGDWAHQAALTEPPIFVARLQPAPRRPLYLALPRCHLPEATIC